MRRMVLSLFLIALSLFADSVAFTTAAKSEKLADDFPSDVASSWFELLYNVVKEERITPPPASRIYGIAAVALYESIVSGAETNQSLVGQLNGLVALPQPEKKKLHWPTVANAT